jgi:hypothetical protein
MRVRCVGGRISRPPPPSPEHNTRASTTSSVNHRGRSLSKWTHAAACLPPSHDYLVVRICCGDGNPSGKGAKTRRTTNIPHPCRTHSISLFTSMHHAIGDYYLIPRQASDEPAYPLTGIMVKKRNKDSSGNECWRTGKLSKSALEETGAKSYMCLEIKRVH